jgi:hypothetical protein
MNINSKEREYTANSTLTRRRTRSQKTSGSLRSKLEVFIWRHVVYIPAKYAIHKINEHSCIGNRLRRYRKQTGIINPYLLRRSRITYSILARISRFQYWNYLLQYFNPREASVTSPTMNVTSSLVKLFWKNVQNIVTTIYNMHINFENNINNKRLILIWRPSNALSPNPW